MMNFNPWQRFEKANRYSELKAEDKLEKGDVASIFVIVFIFPISFIQFFIFKGHFLGGIDGFITSMNAAFYNFMKYSKLEELQKTKDLWTGFRLSTRSVQRYL